MKPITSISNTKETMIYLMLQQTGSLLEGPELKELAEIYSQGNFMQILLPNSLASKGETSSILFDHSSGTMNQLICCLLIEVDHKGSDFHRRKFNHQCSRINRSTSHYFRRFSVGAFDFPHQPLLFHSDSSLVSR